MIFVFYMLAAALVWLSYKSFRGGIRYLRFFRRELAKPVSDFTPFATIIAPCRGLDDGLGINLQALMEQDYPAYEVIFVVDDRADDAVGVINEIINRRDAETQSREAGRPEDAGETLAGINVSQTSAPLRLSGVNLLQTHLVVAPKAIDCSQKVENLREAVLHAADRSEVFVFVDSDARPSPNWLRDLVAPLCDDKIGASTGYRWFIAARRSIGSEMRSVWNASIASALGPNIGSNFCWGGSMAIRRDTFDRVSMREKWRGTLSDDFAVTRTMKAAGLPTVFVPGALTASVEDCTVSEMLEFTTRQMRITRVYAPDLWLMSMVGAGLFNIVMIAAVFIAVFSAAGEISFWAAVATLVLVTLFSIGKAWLRLHAVRLVLTKYESGLKRQFYPQCTLWVLSPAVFFYNSLAAWVSRKMMWRGTLYELKSPTETVIIQATANTNDGKRAPQG